MKQCRRPTRRQKIAIKEAGFNPENWLVERDTPVNLVIIRRETGTVKVIKKGA